MKYNYYLEKGSKKFNCPSCNKKTFVRYISNITNAYANIVYGRCDRESKCQYHKYPTNNNKTTPYQQNTTVNQQQTTTLNSTNNNISFHDIEHLRKTMLDYNNNNFIIYLKKFFVPIDIEKAINLYKIGTSNYWRKSTVFWQIDENYNIRAGKIMQYNYITGKRIKEPKNKIYWMHKTLNINTFNLNQCLYGLHLINELNIDKYICIVEAEKTAIIMSILLPNYIWLATGNKSAFKIEILEAIKHRKIIACPDKSCFSDWNDKATILKKNGYKIEVNNLLEQYKLEEGIDFIDVLI